MKIYIDKLYRYDRVNEPLSVTIPVKKGQLTDALNLAVLDGDKELSVQSKVTARYEDGSVKYIFVRFMDDLPANKGKILECVLNYEDRQRKAFKEILVKEKEDGIYIDNSSIRLELKNNSNSIFNSIDDGNKIYTKDNFEGPYLKDKEGNCYDVHINSWHIIEKGCVCTIVRGFGSNTSAINNKNYDFEITITVYNGKPWLEVAYRLINTSMKELNIDSLVFYAKAEKNCDCCDKLDKMSFEEKPDSTGCGDGVTDNSNNNGPVYHTRGITELDIFDTKAPVKDIRTFVGSSNYKTDFFIGRDGNEVNKHISGEMLVKEANEHYAEVLYGTFMADRTDSLAGLCITVFQAFQNFPKAIKANKEGIAVMLVPSGINSVVMQPGMAREQKFLMHFHKPKETILELDNRSLIYQMPDRPYIPPDEFREAGIELNVFPQKLDDDVEAHLIGKGDAHARCYGMLNFGDSWDSNYTKQGRGNGKIVWSNNEYDFPHSCALEYMRTGIRRFLDYLIISAQHWMDVDICHYNDDILKVGGQWEHTAGHCENGIMVCSHEWVEGLLDYYHFTGDYRGYETAIGIGDNILRLLDTPMYAHPGEANARETGWALRTLTALYIETNDSKWLKKSEWIIDSFKSWEEEYGNWLAPYTDNTTIRVGFMISIAVGSVMRYYRVFNRKDIKDMIIRAVDDLIDNSLAECGLFYYKELPSLQRLGNNTLLLEALAIAFELTGDVKYLYPGLKTFKKAILSDKASTNGEKRFIDEAVICPGESTKGFAQSFIPLITYYKAISDNNIEWRNA